MSFFNTIQRKTKEVSHQPRQRKNKTAYCSISKYGHNSIKKSMCPEGRFKVTIVGNRVTKEFIDCYYLAKALHKYKKRQFEPPLIHGVTGIEWPGIWIRYGAHGIYSQVLVLLNNKFLGGEKEFKEFIKSRYDYYLSIDYYKEGIQQLTNYINSSGRPCAYLHITVNGEDIGTLIVMLYTDIVPRTCENFLRLCGTTKGGYSGTPVHRIVKDCWIQCGGFGLKNSPELACENFIVPHDRRGVLCMANADRDVECSTQFFVLLQPAPWMQHKYVAFGQLIEGEKTLSKIEDVPTWYESPTKEIIIYKAGNFNMHCKYVPINKNTNEYIQGHIEDLNVLGDVLYEGLLEKVFMEIEIKLRKTEYENQTTVDTQNLHATKRFIRKKMQLPLHHDSSTSESSNSSENTDFDVDDYEYEEYTSKDEEDTVPKIVMKPAKPYYLSPSDVPYSGEINSSYDLKKFLRGNYCYEGDIDKKDDFRIKRKQGKEKRLSLPESLINALIGRINEDDLEKSLDSDDQTLVENYIRDNADTVSFAGPVIQKIANFSNKKYQIYDATKK